MLRTLGMVAALMTTGCGAGAGSSFKAQNLAKQASSDPEETAEEVEGPKALVDSTVMLLVLKEFHEGQHSASVEGSGSGFVIQIGSELAIATAAHVVEGATQIIAIHPSGRRTEIHTILGFDAKSDLAILRAEMPWAAKPVQLGDQRPELGEAVTIVSSPLGLDTTLSFGTVAAYRPQLRAFQLAAGISPGSSGGLAADPQGRAIGVIRSKAPNAMEGEHIALITPTQFLRELVDNPQPRPIAEPPNHDRLVLLRRDRVVSTLDSPFTEHPAAGRLSVTTGKRFAEHLCASADDPDTIIALGEEDMMEPPWRVGFGSSCGTFAPETKVVIYVGAREPGEAISIEVERQR